MANLHDSVNSVIIKCVQGTPDWFQARIGRCTASKFKTAVSSGAGRQTYLYDLAAELLTNEKTESYVNDNMQWGIEQEANARNEYRIITDNDVEEVGFFTLGEHIGASPDGLVNCNGLIEIKCPKTSTHIQTVLSNKLPSQYKEQVQGQLWICEKDWCDFVSYDSRIPSEKRIHIIRVERDDKFINELEKGINQFVDELNEIVNKLK